MRVPNNSMSTAIQRMQQTPICIMKHLFISMYFASAQKCVTELNSVTNYQMFCGAWDAGSLGAGTGEWGPLDNTYGGSRTALHCVPKSVPQNIRLCVAQERSSALLGAQERRSPAFTLTLTTETNLS